MQGKGIDENELLNLIKKIEMYRKEEQQIQEKIKSEFDIIISNYEDSNKNTFKKKLDNLYSDFETSLKTKDNYMDLLNNVIKSYKEKDINISEAIGGVNIN